MRRERHASKQVPGRQARRWHGTRQITENALRETRSPDWRRRQTSGTRFNLVNGAYVRHARRNVGLSPWAQFAGPGGRRLRGLPLSRSGVPLATRSFSSLHRAVLGVMRANGKLRTLARRDAGMRRPIPSRLPSRFAIMRPISRAKSHPDEATHGRCEPRPHRPGQSHYMQRWSASAQPVPICQTSLKSRHPRGIGEPARIMGRRPYVRPTMPEQWSRDGVRPPPESSHAHTAGLQAPNRAANNARAGTPEPSARSAASWRGFRRRAREAVGRRRPRSATRFGQSCHAYRRWMS